MDPKKPVELSAARNAVLMARVAGADRHAPELFVEAELLLLKAEALQARNAGRETVAAVAREASEVAEKARQLALEKQDPKRSALP